MTAPTSNKILPYHLRLKLIRNSISWKIKGLHGQARVRRCYGLWCDHLREELSS